MYFLSFRIFEELALALKTEFALKFFKRGGRPPPPTRTPMVSLFFLQPLNARSKHLPLKHPRNWCKNQSRSTIF